MLTRPIDRTRPNPIVVQGPIAEGELVAAARAGDYDHVAARLKDFEARLEKRQVSGPEADAVLDQLPEVHQRAKRADRPKVIGFIFRFLIIGLIVDALRTTD